MNTRTVPVPAGSTAGMFSPVQCAFCRSVYDLGVVEVTSRRLDCSMWKTPCCNTTADDRGENGWKNRQDYYRVHEAQPGAMDVHGRFMWQPEVADIRPAVS